MSTMDDLYRKWLESGRQGPRPVRPSAPRGLPPGNAVMVGEGPTAPVGPRVPPAGLQVPVYPDRQLVPQGTRALVAPAAEAVAGAAAGISPWLTGLGALGAGLLVPQTANDDPVQAELDRIFGMESKLVKGHPVDELWDGKMASTPADETAPMVKALKARDRASIEKAAAPKKTETSPQVAVPVSDSMEMRVNKRLQEREQEAQKMGRGKKATLEERINEREKGRVKSIQDIKDELQRRMNRETY